MKILAVEEHLLNPLGGGELSFRTLLTELSRNHVVCAVGKRVSDPFQANFPVLGFSVFEIPRTHMLNKYLVFRQVERQVAKYIERISPDILITQQDFAAPSVKVACRAGIPSIVFMRNYEHFCLCSDPARECSRHCSACYGYGKYNPYRYCVDAVFAYEKHWLAQASLLVSNSTYMKHIVEDWLGIDSAVVYPFIRTLPIMPHKPEYITFINPKKHKGVEIVLRLAELLPDRAFMVVGHAPDSRELRVLPNITCVPWVDEISGIYSRTRILLVPSRWPEPFGRVCAEAAQFGIPCIASRAGGIPEAVGDGGILINARDDPDDWLRAIETLDSEAVYQELSRNARHHAENFTLGRIIESFQSQVRERLGIQL